MREEGTLASLKWKWFSGPCLSKSEHEAMWNAVPYQDKAAGVISNLIDEKAVSLRRFGAPLILLLIGVFLSFIVLGVEMVWVQRYGEVGVWRSYTTARVSVLQTCISNAWYVR